MVVGRGIEQVWWARAPFVGIAVLVCVGCGGSSLPPPPSSQSPASPSTASSQPKEATPPRSDALKDQPSARPKTAPPENSSADSSATSTPNQTQPADESERRVAVHTDAQGRKWLGDVPYDVFFDNPLAVAAEGKQQAVADGARSAPGLARSAEPASPRSSESGTGKPEGAAPAADQTWQNLIDIDILDAEVKRVRNDLTAGLQSVAKYNAHYRDVSIAGATLAALAEIAAEHPGSVSWKKNAPAIRDLGRKIHDASSALGGQAYQAAKAPYEQLIDVLDGNPPTGLPASEPRTDFAKVAKRDGLMKRMDHALDWLKKGGGGPAQRLRKESAAALRETSLLAAFSRVIAVGHYDSADDEKYKNHAEELMKAAQSATAGVKSEDAAAFTEAIGRVQKRCDACHADYRFQ